MTSIHLSSRARPAFAASTRFAAGAMLGLLALLGGLMAAPRAQAAPVADPHAAHKLAAGQDRSEQNYVLPAVKMTRGDGKRMTLAEALDDGRPVMLNFIYTSCNAICPVTSQVFVEVRERLGAERDKINMVSISIDPEQDTPRRLTAYAKRFGSAGTWAHYTSSSADAIEIQRAFGAWRGDKMNHQPTTYMRGAPGKPWVRLDGFFSPEDLVSNYLHVVQGQGDDNCAEPPRKTAANSHLTLASTRPQTFSSTADHPIGLPTKTKP
jgi:protein SCO1/2